MHEVKDLLYKLILHDLKQLVERHKMQLSADEQHVIADHLSSRLTENQGRMRRGRRLYDLVRERLTLHWPRWLR